MLADTTTGQLLQGDTSCRAGFCIKPYKPVFRSVFHCLVQSTLCQTVLQALSLSLQAQRVAVLLRQSV